MSPATGASSITLPAYIGLQLKINRFIQLQAAFLLLSLSLRLRHDVNAVKSAVCWGVVTFSTTLHTMKTIFGKYCVSLKY